jgi:hypothetical protein
MTAVKFIRLQAEVVDAAVKAGIIDANDNIQTKSVADWEAFAVSVVAILKEYGVIIPDQVDKAVAALPLILGLLGIK